MTKEQAIKELNKLRENTHIDGELTPILNIIANLEDETLQDDITEQIRDGYITNEDQEQLYGKHRLSTGFDMDAMRCGMGDANYNYPIFINGYQNLKREDANTTIDTIIDGLEEEKEEVQYYTGTDDLGSEHLVTKEKFDELTKEHKKENKGGK